MARIAYEKKVSPTGVAAYVAITKKPRVRYDGSRFTATTAVRIIEEKQGYRTDFCSAVAGTFMPWEPITEVAYPTVAAAKKAVQAFVTAEPA